MKQKHSAEGTNCTEPGTLPTHVTAGQSEFQTNILSAVH